MKYKFHTFCQYVLPLLSGILMLCTPATAQNLRLELPVISASAGDTLRVLVRSQGITGATSLSLGIRYSTSSLTFLNVEAQGTALASASIASNTTGNLLSIAALPAQPQALPLVDSTLLILRFLAQGGSAYLIWDTTTEVGLSQQPHLIHGVIRPAGTSLPSLTTNGNRAACEFGSAQFSLSGTSGIISYQWMSLHPGASNPVALSPTTTVNGPNSSILTLSQLLLSDSGQVLLCQATGPGYTLLSRPQALSVRPLSLIPITLQTTPSGVVCAGNPLQISVAGLPGGATGNYQWYVNGQPSGTSAFLTRSDFRAGDEVILEFTDSVNCSTGQAQLALNIAPAPVDPTINGEGCIAQMKRGLR